ncbi:MAG: hypothetical protein UY52_C0044G0008 [Parcubacteria group bacterium GW2011_GWC2_49_9]|nr:MAG: hypothetical protein UY52_C0044G0008 [Parcubacteria group bacterium GW2011_GWC2_49_9]
MAKQISILVIAVLLHATLFVGCNNESPTNAIRLYESWIARMDPFVTTESNGTYTLDWNGFLASIQPDHGAVAKYFAGIGLLSDDAKIIEELKGSIPIANAEILQANAKRSNEALQPEVAGACWTYWWGRRCCYWGAEGWRIVTLLEAGAFLPAPFNVIIGGLGLYLAYYMSVYNGFCLNASWVGGQWVTRP